MSAILHRLGGGWGSVCFKTGKLVKRGPFLCLPNRKSNIGAFFPKVKVTRPRGCDQGESPNDEEQFATNISSTYSNNQAVSRHQGTAGRVPPAPFTPKAHVRRNIPAQLGFKSRREVCVVH